MFLRRAAAVLDILGPMTVSNSRFVSAPRSPMTVGANLKDLFPTLVLIVLVDQLP
jgi:hypothetical protein